MQPFTRVTGQAAPLMLANIDTDVIIRIERLSDPSPAHLRLYALEALRYFPDGSENPDFILNQPRFRGAPILLAGANFGCGSSREGAVWALMALGIRCVLAASFGDIFYSNCFQNGLLPVVLPESTVQALAGQTSTGESPMTIDLVRQLVISPAGEELSFEIDKQRREALLEGLDDIDRTLKHVSAITAWQAADRLARPWVWQPVTTHHAQR
jgi:3-isopropylmalate/(R)-2-methylmalate dehydratase small subunit